MYDISIKDKIFVNKTAIREFYPTKVCLIKFFCDLVNFPFQTRSRVAEICFVKDWIFANDLCPERMMVLKICNFLRT